MWRYCPECGDEFRPDVVRCADCGVALVDTAPSVPEQAKVYGSTERDAASLTESQRSAIAMRLRASEIPFSFESDRLIVPAAHAQEVDAHIAEVVDTQHDERLPLSDDSDRDTQRRPQRPRPTAPTWQRLIASYLDLLLFMIPFNLRGEMSIARWVFVGLIAVYHTLAVWRIGATFGKWLLRCQVVRLDGHRPALLSSFLRTIPLVLVLCLPQSERGQIAYVLFLMINIASMMAGPDVRSVADRVAGTKVVRVPR